VVIRHRADGGVEVGLSRLGIAVASALAVGAIFFLAVGLRTWSIVPMTQLAAVISVTVFGGLLSGGLAIVDLRMTLSASKDRLALPRIGRRKVTWGSIRSITWSPDDDFLRVVRGDGTEIGCGLGVLGALRREGTALVLRAAEGFGASTIIESEPSPSGRWPGASHPLEVRMDVRRYRAGSIVLSIVTITMAIFAVSATAQGDLEAVAFFGAWFVVSTWLAVTAWRTAKEPPVLYRIDDAGIGAADGRVDNIVPWPPAWSVDWADVREVRARRYGDGLAVEFLTRDSTKPLVAKPVRTVLTTREFIAECRRRADRANPGIRWPSDRTLVVSS
jgi:hypothetical protein